jgi:hypothetical protein
MEIEMMPLAKCGAWTRVSGSGHVTATNLFPRWRAQKFLAFSDERSSTAPTASWIPFTRRSGVSWSSTWVRHSGMLLVLAPSGSELTSRRYVCFPRMTARSIDAKSVLAGPQFCIADSCACSCYSLMEYRVQRQKSCECNPNGGGSDDVHRQPGPSRRRRRVIYEQERECLVERREPHAGPDQLWANWRHTGQHRRVCNQSGREAEYEAPSGCYVSTPVQENSSKGKDRGGPSHQVPSCYSSTLLWPAARKSARSSICDAYESASSPWSDRLPRIPAVLEDVRRSWPYSMEQKTRRCYPSHHRRRLRWPWRTLSIPHHLPGPRQCRNWKGSTTGVGQLYKFDTYSDHAPGRPSTLPFFAHP